MKFRRLSAVAIVSILTLAACGSDDDADSSSSDSLAPTATEAESASDTVAQEPVESTPAESTPAESTPAPTEESSPSGASELQLIDTPLGSVLGDSEGYAVYLFTPDGQGPSTCYDDCEATWPFVAEITTVGDGLDSSLLGTVERTTGEIQATYNGWPLYIFVNDAAPGDTNGQGVGGVWFVLDATGTAIEG